MQADLVQESFSLGCTCHDSSLNFSTLGKNAPKTSTRGQQCHNQQSVWITSITSMFFQVIPTFSLDHFQKKKKSKSWDHIIFKMSLLLHLILLSKFGKYSIPLQPAACTAQQLSVVFFLCVTR